MGIIHLLLPHLTLTEILHLGFERSGFRIKEFLYPAHAKENTGDSCHSHSKC